MMSRIITSSLGHPLKEYKILTNNEYACSAYSMAKLITRHFTTKMTSESLKLLERIQRDICGLIHPSCRPFRYFMILIDTSTGWSHVSLLSVIHIHHNNLLLVKSMIFHIYEYLVVQYICE